MRQWNPRTHHLLHYLFYRHGTLLLRHDLLLFLPPPSSSSSSPPAALLASLQDELRRIDEDVARSLVKMDKSMETWREGLEKVIG